LQAEIGQNRSVFPKRTKQPGTSGSNDLTELAGFVARRSRELAAEDIAGRRLLDGAISYQLLAVSQKIGAGIGPASFWLIANS
jgi:hypothetical protein